MKQFNTKQELRQTIKNSEFFKIVFDCGRYFTKTTLDGGSKVNHERLHDHRYDWNEYNEEGFVNAVWNKLNRVNKHGYKSIVEEVVYK